MNRMQRPTAQASRSAWAPQAGDRSPGSCCRPLARANHSAYACSCPASTAPRRPHARSGHVVHVVAVQQHAAEHLLRLQQVRHVGPPVAAVPQGAGQGVVASRAPRAATGGPRSQARLRRQSRSSPGGGGAGRAPGRGPRGCPALACGPQRARQASLCQPRRPHPAGRRAPRCRRKGRPARGPLPRPALRRRSCVPEKKRLQRACRRQMSLRSRAA